MSQTRQIPSVTRRGFLAGTALQVSLTTASAQSSAKRILVYTRNGQGYVHDNIASSVAAIRDDPSVFADSTLKLYKAIVFSNSNNEAFTSDAQRDAFQRYIKAGGGFAGIHSASGSERNWPYYWSIIGGKFLRHPKLQKFTIRVKDSSHPATRGMPAAFEWEDECYFLGFMNPDLHPLLVTDPSKLDDPQRAEYPRGLMGDAMPLAWTLRQDGSRQFYTALGHKKEDYANPILYNHIMGGILWVMEERQ